MNNTPRKFFKTTDQIAFLSEAGFFRLDAEDDDLGEEMP
jgi:hypothetical protein